jgi:hypothetical protein
MKATRKQTLVLSSLVETLVNGQRQVRLLLSERRPQPGGGHVDAVASQMAIPAEMLDALREVADELAAQLAHAAAAAVGG